MMYLWKLEREGSQDETVGLVLVAETEADARQIAHDKARGDWSPDTWFAPSTEINAVGTAFDNQQSGEIILTDFWEG